jgi:hypothetical protein
MYLSLTVTQDDRPVACTCHGPVSINQSGIYVLKDFFGAPLLGRGMSSICARLLCTRLLGHSGTMNSICIYLMFRVSYIYI